MTNQEAITKLTNILNDDTYSWHPAHAEALEMAVEALKASDLVNESSGLVKDSQGDLISRQAAIDAILAVTGNSSVRELYEHVQEHGLSDMWSGGVNAAIDIIIAVPPVQPEPCGDVVSRNAIVQKLNEMDRYVSTELRLCDTDKKFPQNEVFIVDDVYEEIVEQLPSAQPEIIRCKDCKHWRQQTNYQGAPLPFGFCESDDMWRSLYGEIYEVSHIDTDDDFYCGYAERRTDE